MPMRVRLLYIFIPKPEFLKREDIDERLGCITDAEQFVSRSASRSVSVWIVRSASVCELAIEYLPIERPESLILAVEWLIKKEGVCGADINKVEERLGMLGWRVIRKAELKNEAVYAAYIEVEK